LRTLRERDISVFYSTHILDDVERVADHIAIMKDGKRVRSGVMREMMAATQGAFTLTVEAPAEGIEKHLRTQPWVTGVERAAEPAAGRAVFALSVADEAQARRARPRSVIDADYVLIGCEPTRQRLEDIFIESSAEWRAPHRLHGRLVRRTLRC